jgi:hypothetical protein
MKKPTTVSPVAPLPDDNSSLDSSKGSDNARVKIPVVGLLALIKERLKPDFHRDAFNQPKLQGTPPQGETVQLPPKKFLPASNELNFSITPSDFSEYKLKLMSPPSSDNKLSKQTLYLEYDNNQLICTVCDAHRAIAQSVINVSDLKKLDINIAIPLRSTEITPLVPHILTVLKICDLKEGKRNLAEQTQEKNQPDYLESLCESVMMKLYQEKTILAQIIGGGVAPESPIKKKYEALDKEIADFLDLIKPENIMKIVKNVNESSKGSYNQLDIVAVVKNLLSHKMEGFSGIISSLKKEVIQESVRQEAHKPMQQWTQREVSPVEKSKNNSADEIEKRQQDDNAPSNIP